MKTLHLLMNSLNNSPEVDDKLILKLVGITPCKFELKKNFSSILKIPLLSFEIFKYFGPEELCLLAQVSRSWKNLVQNNYLWYTIVLKLLHPKMKYNSQQIFRTIYKDHVLDKVNKRKRQELQELQIKKK